MTCLRNIAVLVAFSSASSVSFALTVPTPYVSCNQNGERAYGLTPAVSCLGFGSGNINGAGNDRFLASIDDGGQLYSSTYELISLIEDGEWSDVGSPGKPPGFITASFSIDPGTWTDLWASYSALAVGIKVGNNWAVWSVDSNSSGEFQSYVTPKTGGGLSHYNIYGTPGTGPDEPLTPVPLPAAAWLFVSGLAAYAGFQRKKSKSKDLA